MLLSIASYAPHPIMEEKNITNIGTIEMLTAEALSAGRTILYPTDTIWGVGCDAGCAAAIHKLYQLKERDRSKSMLVLIGQAVCRELLLNLLPNRPLHDQLHTLLLASPRPTTVIIPSGLGIVEGLTERHLVDSSLLAADGSLGLRMPQHPFCQRLLTLLGRPIVSSSANLSGQPTPTTYEEISAELKQRVDYCVPHLPHLQSHCRQSSRILKLSPTGDIIIIRE